MKTFSLSETVDVQDILNGSISYLTSCIESEHLLNHAKQIVENNFGKNIGDISHKDYQLKDFVEFSTKSKTAFTDGEETQDLMKQLILSRYTDELYPYAIYDKPRIRIIPNSNYLSSGISYNYKPHRDTWYGGTPEQVNHWMPLSNVTRNSTFYLAPDFFNAKLKNNSEVFDLDTWDHKFRKQASSNVKQEDRPHPVPSEEVTENNRYFIVIPIGTEVVFSGHHLHGSGINTTDRVRFSIDYRVVIQKPGYTYPENIDNKATGDLKNYMLKV